MINNPTQITAFELSLILNITETTIKKLAKSDQIPHQRIKNRIVFNFHEVLQYFQKLETEGGVA